DAALAVELALQQPVLAEVAAVGKCGEHQCEGHVHIILSRIRGRQQRRASDRGAARRSPRHAFWNASRRIKIAWATAARVAHVLLSGLSIMKSCVMPA